VPLIALVRPTVELKEMDDQTTVIVVHHFAVFSNWLLLRKHLLAVDFRRDVVVDMTETRLVDHTVMEKLHEMQREFEAHNHKLEVIGLDKHHRTSSHPHSARVRRNVAS
jgi:MFS superfamily sulfate permease-like transporter